MDSRLPLSPWASDGFFLLVRRLPGWPQAMRGHRRSYCVTSAFGDSHRTPRGASTSDKPLGRMLARLCKLFAYVLSRWPNADEGACRRESEDFALHNPEVLRRCRPVGQPNERWR